MDNFEFVQFSTRRDLAWKALGIIVSVLGLMFPILFAYCFFFEREQYLNSRRLRKWLYENDVDMKRFHENTYTGLLSDNVVLRRACEGEWSVWTKDENWSYDDISCGSLLFQMVELDFLSIYEKRETSRLIERQINKVNA